MKQDKIVQMIVDARRGWEIYRGGIQECANAYFMVLDKQTCELKRRYNRSHIFFPKVTAKARRITDALSETYFMNNELAKLSKYINTDDDILKKWQQAVDFYSVSQNLYLTFQPIFQEIPYMGTCVVKVYWAGDNLHIDKVDLDDFWFDVNTKTSQDVKYLVHNIYLTIDEIKILQKNGHFKKTFSVDETFSESKPSERIRLQEVYFYEGKQWKVTTIYNESVIMRENIVLKDGHPFIWGGLLWQTKNIFDINFIPCYFEPPIAAMLPLQDETNAIRNMINDNARQGLYPKFITSKTDGVNQDDIYTIGKHITSNNPNAIKTLDNGNPITAMNLVPIMEQDMAEVTGISPQQNGISPVRQETATLSTIVANEGGTRLQGYIRTFNETFFEPCFQRVAILVWKYGRDDFFIGIDRTEVPSFEVKVNTGIGALNKEVQKQGLLQANAMLGQYFQMCGAAGDQQGAMQALNASKEIMKQILPLYGVTEIQNLLGEEDDKNRDFTGQIEQVSTPSQIGGVI